MRRWLRTRTAGLSCSTAMALPPADGEPVHPHGPTLHQDPHVRDAGGPRADRPQVSLPGRPFAGTLAQADLQRGHPRPSAIVLVADADAHLRLAGEDLVVERNRGAALGPDVHPLRRGRRP